MLRGLSGAGVEFVVVGGEAAVLLDPVLLATYITSWRVLPVGPMTPPLDKLAAAPESRRTFPGIDAAVLREATARMNALGIDGDVVHSTSDPAEMMAYIESLPARAPTS